MQSKILLTAVLTESSGRVSKTCIVITSDESAIVPVPTKFLWTISSALHWAGFIRPLFDFKCIVLYPAGYIDTILRFSEFTPSLYNTNAVASLARLDVI